MSHLKRGLFSLVRRTHQAMALKPLPRKLGIYFHALDQPHWPAFENGMRYLKQLGYRSVDAATFTADTSGDRLVYVSFDDNYRSWFEARHMLEELEITATFFTNTLPFRDVADAHTIEAYFDRVAHHGDRTPMTRAELRALSDAGHRVGCHSHSHFRLSSLPPAVWQQEIDGCRTILEDIIAAPVTDFSFPFGMRRHFSETLRSYCQLAGFETISAATPGLLHAPQSDPFNIARTRWLLDRPIGDNLVDLRIDGQIFEQLTGRSAIG